MHNQPLHSGIHALNQEMKGFVDILLVPCPQKAKRVQLTCEAIVFRPVQQLDLKQNLYVQR